MLTCLSLEHLLDKTQPSRTGLPKAIRHRPTTRIRTWCMEGNLHPFDEDPARHWRGCGAGPEQLISTSATLWEGDNMPVHRKSFGDVEISCKRFRGSSAGNNMVPMPYVNSMADHLPTVHPP